MKLKIIVVALKTDKPVEEDTSKLRGYIGKKFPQYILLHHHTDKGVLYTYPRIQYKIIEKTPIIVGIEEGAKILKEIVDELQELKLGRKMYKIQNIIMSQFNADFGKKREMIKYKFLTPWLGLSQKNYAIYKSKKTWKERKELLHSILVGNLLAISKSFGYTVRGKLYASAFFNSCVVKYKAIPHAGFTGEFRVNFILPDYIGIGKGVSHGFGTVKKIVDEKEK